MTLETRRRRNRPRHPAEITSDRLADHVERWYEKTDGPLRDAIARVRDWLEDIAEDAGR